MEIGEITLAEDAHFLGIPDRIAAHRQRPEPLRLALQCGDEDNPPRMEAIGRAGAEAECVDCLAQRIGKIGDLGGAGQRVGLAEARRIGRNTGEMFGPLAHQRFVFRRGARALVHHQQCRSRPAAAVMHAPACAGNGQDVPRYHHAKVVRTNFTRQASTRVYCPLSKWNRTKKGRHAQWRN